MKQQFGAAHRFTVLQETEKSWQICNGLKLKLVMFLRKYRRSRFLLWTKHLDKKCVCKPAGFYCGSQSDELCVLRHIAHSRTLCCAGVAVFRTRFCLRPNLNYSGADKSLARPGRKQANVFVRMACVSFGVLPYRRKRTWWQLVSRCCWNRARPLRASRLISVLVELRTYQHPAMKIVKLYPVWVGGHVIVAADVPHTR